MDAAAWEAVLVPALKAGFLLVLAGGVAAVLRRLALLARGQATPAAKAGEKEKN